MIKVNNINVENRPKSVVKSNNNMTNAGMQRVPFASSNNLLSAFDTASRSLISFKGLEFYQTLNENYFKLPEGASPDEYQREAAKKLHEGHDVLVTAPTGTGKTAIAHYVITKNMEDGKRTFYTTPLKALSNEKYKQLQNIYGKENVGILTGDVKINAQAPIIVMTTEIYRNMVFGKQFKEEEASSNLKNLKTVIFDELHYLGDVDRGGTWEQSIILSDQKTQLLSLSATIGNNNTINDWMSSVKGRGGDLVNVPSEKRHVPLEFNNTFRADVMTRGHNRNSVAKQEKASLNDPKATPDKLSFIKLIKLLDKEEFDNDSKEIKNKLPAIFFVFNKKFSKELLNSIKKHGEPLTTMEEQEQIIEIVERYEREGKYLGESLDMDMLLAGYSMHNSGLLPAQKELIEELFQKKLVKVVIATETLAAGINMPARTVVISATRKPTTVGNSDGSDGRRELTPNEFHQMAGRAGRRGIDKKGFVYTMPVNDLQRAKFAALIEATPNDLESHFDPEYSFVVNYYKKAKDDNLIKSIINKSLYTYDINEEESQKKSVDMLKTFKNKKQLLKQLDFIKEDNTLLPKGEMLSKINGYYQVPIIEAICDYKKTFAQMDPMELATCAGLMANLEEKADGSLDKKEKIETKSKDIKSIDIDALDDENLEGSKLSDFFAFFNEVLGNYNAEISDRFTTFSKIEQNNDIARHIYGWAQLNNENKNSRENWANLFNGDMKSTISDEGGLFREITQTVDLLKQMSNIVDKGIAASKDDSDVKDYEQMKENIANAIDLITKEPVPSARSVQLD